MHSRALNPRASCGHRVCFVLPVFFLDIIMYITCIVKNRLPVIRKYSLLMSAVFGSNCRCKQLFNLIKNVKSRIRARLNWRDVRES
jgi:hypothetical protein